MMYLMNFREQDHAQRVSKLLKRVMCSPVGIFGGRPGVKLEENYTHGCFGGLMTKFHSVISEEER